jgi:hypothetical protein
MVNRDANRDDRLDCIALAMNMESVDELRAYWLRRSRELDTSSSIAKMRSLLTECSPDTLQRCQLEQQMATDEDSDPLACASELYDWITCTARCVGGKQVLERLDVLERCTQMYARALGEHGWLDMCTRELDDVAHLWADAVEEAAERAVDEAFENPRDADYELDGSQRQAKTIAYTVFDSMSRWAALSDED